MIGSGAFKAARGLSGLDIGAAGGAAIAGVYGVAKVFMPSYHGSGGAIRSAPTKQDLLLDMGILGGGLSDESFLGSIGPTSPMSRAVENVKQFSNIGIPHLPAATAGAGLLKGALQAGITYNTLETLLPKVPKKHMAFGSRAKTYYSMDMSTNSPAVNPSHKFYMDKDAPRGLVLYQNEYDPMYGKNNVETLKLQENILKKATPAQGKKLKQRWRNNAKAKYTPPPVDISKRPNRAASFWGASESLVIPEQHVLAKTIGRNVVKWGGTALAFGMGVRSAVKGAMELGEGFFNTIDASIRDTHGLQSGQIDRRNTRAGGGTRSWTKPTLGRRMQPNNLASGGDLVLAMHRVRHKSMI